MSRSFRTSFHTSFGAWGIPPPAIEAVSAILADVPLYLERVRDRVPRRDHLKQDFALEEISASVALVDPHSSTHPSGMSSMRRLLVYVMSTIRSTMKGLPQCKHSYASSYSPSNSQLSGSEYPHHGHVISPLLTARSPMRALARTVPRNRRTTSVRASPQWGRIPMA